MSHMRATAEDINQVAAAMSSKIRSTEHTAVSQKEAFFVDKPNWVKVSDTQWARACVRVCLCVCERERECVWKNHNQTADKRKLFKWITHIKVASGNQLKGKENWICFIMQNAWLS